METLSKGKELEKQLTYKVEHIAKKDKSAVEKSFEFCDGYMDFLSRSKTERLAVANIIEIAKANGYVEFDPTEMYQPGDKIYFNNRGKSAILSTIGKLSASDGFTIVASHIDSPRLDLKPNPLYENTEISYFKTHYYGGIKKYQWSVIPLAIHGVVVKTNGEKVDIHIGEEDDDLLRVGARLIR